MRERLRNSAQRQYFLLILKTRRTKEANGESDEHDFNPTGFVGGICRQLMGLSSGGGSECVAYLNWRLRQTAIAELAVLSDRELKDIGLKRGEIENAVTNTLKRERAFNR